MKLQLLLNMIRKLDRQVKSDFAKLYPATLIRPKNNEVLKGE
jgi:hypothetical protein